MDRISREQMFIEIAKTVSKRSTCTRKQVGCVLVLENRIIAIGYNGVLPGRPESEGLDSEGNSHTVHAEANIIAFCARNGIPTFGTSIWVTLQPCEKCAELLIQAGIYEVNYLEEYRCDKGVQLLINNNIKVNKHA
jgi:dCMP deaminase